MTAPDNDIAQRLYSQIEENLVRPITEMRELTQEVRDIRDSGAVPNDAVGLPQLNPAVRSTVEGLPAALAGKADTGHAHTREQVTGLDTALAGKADLVNGEVPTSQIPAVALTKPQSVSSRGAMLTLTDVQEGDVVIITEGEDKASYMLGDGDPTVFESWHTLVVSQDAPVTSVNGQVGVIVLGPSDVGAAPATHSHTPQQVGAAPAEHTHEMDDVDGLDEALDSKAPAHQEVEGDWPATGTPGTIYWKAEQ